MSQVPIDLRDIAADTPPQEVLARLSLPTPPEPDAERVAELEAFSRAATFLQTVNVDIDDPLSHERTRWNAAAVLDGRFEVALRDVPWAPRDFASRLVAAVRRVLAAADAHADELVLLLRAPLNDVDAGELVLEWLDGRREAVDRMALAAAQDTVVADGVAALRAAAADAGGLQGWLVLRTFGPDT